MPEPKLIPLATIKDKLHPTVGLRMAENLLRVVQDRKLLSPKHKQAHIVFRIRTEDTEPSDLIDASPDEAIAYAIETCQKAHQFFVELGKDARRAREGE